MLTSYCGGRSGRLTRLQPKFRKGRHCRVEQGCDPTDPRRNLFEQLQLLASLRRFRNSKTGGVAARTLSPDKKLVGGARDHRARIFDYAAGTRPAASSSHRVGLNRKSSPKRRYSP
jgi:hypothetical protein